MRKPVRVRVGGESYQVVEDTARGDYTVCLGAQTVTRPKTQGEAGVRDMVARALNVPHTMVQVECE